MSFNREIDKLQYFIAVKNEWIRSTCGNRYTLGKKNNWIIPTAQYHLSKILNTKQYYILF